jgi:acyl-CoA reductase-like NAD-dependent aldehyde dehydrogenase
VTAASTLPLNIVRNPATGEQLAELPQSTTDEVDGLVARATSVQRSWARVPRHARSALMLDYVAVLRAHREELAAILTSENGKPIGQARDEVDTVIRIFKGFAERVIAWDEEARFLDTEPGRERDVQFTHWEPLGVVVGIVPFNFPAELQAWKVAPAIAAGNAIVVKPSSSTPLVGTRMVELMAGLGFPDGLVQIVHAPGSVGAALAAHPGVAAVALTGSTEAGLAVAAAGARTLKRVALELGGNDAMVVLADADLDLVVAEAVAGRSLANGQVCCATKRVIAERPVADSLAERLAVAYGGLRLGNPAQPSTQLGPVINASAAAAIAGQVSEAVRQGARVIAGGTAPDGAFLAPTVLFDDGATADVSHDVEIFGPVLDVIPFDSTQQAIDIANASQFGLSGSVFSRDTGRALDVALGLETGSVAINGTGLYRADQQAWGGYKLSGNVRESLNEGLEEFSQRKTVTLRNILGATRG